MPVACCNRRGFSAEKASPAVPAKYGSLAQLAEHLPFKQGVRGSNPR